MDKRSLLLLVVLLGAARLPAQGIQVKTVPLLAADQFSFFPSWRDDMGGAALALRDPAGDLWENPARFMAVKSFFLTAPRLNHWSYAQESIWHYRHEEPFTTNSETRSSSRLFTLPVVLVYRQGDSYGGGLLGYQSVAASGSDRENFSAANYPLAVTAGHYFSRLRTAVGLSGHYAHLQGTDGLYLLYPNASRLSQRGRLWQLRLGLAGDRPTGDQWGALAGWYGYRLRQSARGVENMDENEGWFAQADYRKRLSPALDAAVSLLWDQKYHPKIPDYPIAGIPRDPGRTRGINIGAGLKWAEGGTIAAVDLIYEPIDVKTWADAAADFTTWDGRLFRKGAVTMRNDYQFHNLILRSGLQISPLPWLDLRSGLQIRFYSYDYYQNDFINRFERRGKPQREWTEVDATGGATVTLERIAISYSLRLQTGTGLLERQWLWFWDRMEDFSAGADFIVPPTVTLNVTPVTYYTHRVTLRWSL